MESVALTKRYYSISEVAQMFDMNISKLRFWEEQFPSLNPKRDRSGDRKYTQEDINHLREIVDLVENQGYTIEGAKRALESKKKKKQENQAIIDRLADIKKFMQELREAIDENKEETNQST
ncbi:MerR family transcriptional regulator [Arcicella sp. DC2W]|uniref:MerR family transcriptional regulator n=1 Tax=Arcicella gelida TaxID=2984195 RepID=A0ABU5S570_9BACT|nr:MerR family transcriptional regulator [Arcicella sp. DC2W]MEA5403647.1 MerR family transcriptional regulator [Arcicella sp. DC2W]